MSEINKLRWRCRRGTLELDLILIRYLENHYLAASREQQAAFRQLLELEDSDLLRFVMAERQPDNPAIAELVACIRSLPVA